MAKQGDPLRVPSSLQAQLRAYRGRVWLLKLSEALAIGVASVAIAYLAVFVMDRLVDTPAAVRTAVFFAALAGCAVTPWFLHRWVWRRRTPKQLARLLTRRMPRLGDQLLGVIELAENRSEQSRSPVLVEAAMNQTALDAAARDLSEATPPSRRPAWGAVAGLGALAAVALAALLPAAAQNAWARLLRPWGDDPRYTFAALEPLPQALVVAHGEPFDLNVALRPGSEWRPAEAHARVGRQQPVEASLAEDGYTLVVPPQITPDALRLSVGDARQTIRIEPTVRPELVSLTARVELPEYLGRTEPQERDARGGALSAVKGSRVSLTATASRPLASAAVDGAPSTPRGAEFDAPAAPVEENTSRRLEWTDRHGLTGAAPLELSISALEDASPTLIVENLPGQKVVLESELINFTVRARDDFGVRRVGFQWRGFPGAVEAPSEGERVLASGDPHAESADAQGVFSAESLGIPPQPLAVRAFVEDYFPDRGRVYSAPHVLYVLSPDQHAIWMTDQLSKWRRQALEVRDRELQLYEENRAIRALAADQLDLPETRSRVQAQADAEQANGRRLARLTAAGAELVREASRNPEIGVGHLEKWAQMLGLLDEIAANRMPTVADLLKRSSAAPKLASSVKKPTAPMAGQVRDTSGGGKAAEADPNSKPPAPSLVDRESSQRSPDALDDEADPTKKKASRAKLTLPVTTVAGAAKKGEKKEPSPAGDKLEEAVTEQEGLLAEFDKIADELNEILANLEGSTLVKRLKAASRTQYQIAGRAGEAVPESFGKVLSAVPQQPREVLKTLVKKQEESGLQVSYIMDDMDAYFERRQMTRFKQVLDEMREGDVLGGLRRLEGDLTQKQGIAIAESEYWSDSLDRWGDDLVDPACAGSCPGGASPESLPPSLVLEAMKILEGEINLREETRVAEQARSAVGEADHAGEAERLSVGQEGLRIRTVALSERILELQDAWRHFGRELNLLTAVEGVMGDATGILARPDTGPQAVAAETEAIELLLASKKINPKGGGGGGASPGGGGGGDTNTPAIALLGRGVNEKEVREAHEVQQTTGETGQALPAEFRAGLDEYFSRLENPGENS
ncbi:hypothetical protein Pla175_32260 [Pirellulimonas nuda]|uniref:DUF4175 family protein n=1 Tax=Pirellulimonas nuda TaxID=2528009 RepID=A0A518DEC2_9BACT|nr:hypothetical protein [Pirellulimonas nuda]QDU89830.1 hypothetical protein Pla175_32260 [Pirellulimonas nuda]